MVCSCSCIWHFCKLISLFKTSNSILLSVLGCLYGTFFLTAATHKLSLTASLNRKNAQHSGMLEGLNSTPHLSLQT